MVLHPTLALSIWLMMVAAVQFAGPGGLAGLVLGALVAAPSCMALWLGYLWRAKWLFCALWLILGWNTPGEAWLGFSWGPTEEGMAEGALHAARLAVMLAWLAWLFQTQGRDGLMSGLWGIMQPLHRLGWTTERLAVRLSLVLAAVQDKPQPGAWRRMLHAEPAVAEGPATMRVALPPWRGRDLGAGLLAVAVMLGVLAW